MIRLFNFSLKAFFFITLIIQIHKIIAILPSTIQDLSEYFSHFFEYLSYFKMFNNGTYSVHSTLHDLLDLTLEHIIDILPDNILQLIAVPLYSCVDFNRTAFEITVRQELFGQLIFDLNVPKILEDFFTDVEKKVLLMSFHGPPGCGKSHAAKIIAENFFEEGLQAKCVGLYYGIRDFHDEKEKEKYPEKLAADVHRLSYKCERQLFIFDDLDNMVPSVIDALLPYIFNENQDVLKGKSIFLFLSNTGAEKIKAITYDAWLNFVPRENLILKNFISHLEEAAYNEKGGLQYSDIVRKKLIDVYVPFLPLEKEHVIQCINKGFKLLKRQLDVDPIKKIAEKFEYYPEEFPIYSISGCKKVLMKISLYHDI